MRSNATGEVTCVFENAGGRAEAQKFIMDRIRNMGSVKDLTFTSLRIIQWSDPESNQVRTFMHEDGKMYNRFTAQFTVTFTLEGSYAEAQAWLDKQLREGEGQSYMNVQSINLFCSPLAGQ